MPTTHAQRLLGNLYEDLILGHSTVVSPSPGTQPAWCAPGDVSRMLFEDSSAVVAVILAMLRQATHPVISQAFLEHDYALADPLQRVHLTSDFYFATTFGTGDDALSWIARARHGHRPVRGRTPAGNQYSAAQGELLSWAHLCVLDSTIQAWAAFGPGPTLSDEDVDRFVREQALAAALIGVPEPPMSAADLRRDLTRARPIHRSPQAQQAVRTVLRPALPHWARVPYAMLAHGAVSLLSGDERAILGLRPAALPGAAEMPVRMLRDLCPRLSVARVAAERDIVALEPSDISTGSPLLLTGRDWQSGTQWAQDHPHLVPWVHAWFVADPNGRSELLNSAPISALGRSGQVTRPAAAAGAWAGAQEHGWSFVWRRLQRRR